MPVKEVDVAIIGAGSAGLNAMAQVRKAGKSFVLINGGHYGTTCARVGCMPSKAFIQVADDMHRSKVYGRFGIEGGSALSLDAAESLDYVRDLRDGFVERVTSNSTDKMGPDVRIDGYAEFLDEHRLKVGETEVRAQRIVIATGSSPVVPEAWAEFGDRILTTDDFFEIEDLPESMAVIGLGVIGLELGQSLARLGVDAVGIDALETIGGVSDPEVSKSAIETIKRDLPMWLGQQAQIEREGDRLRVSAGENSKLVDKVLVSIGRRPNLANLKLDRLGVELDERGVPKYDRQTMQIGNLPIFIAGDVLVDRPVLHEAGEEGKIAGFNAASQQPVRFKRKTPLSITFSDPNIVQVGKPWSELKDDENLAVGEIKFGPIGRALIMAANRGVLRLYADRRNGNLLGMSMIGPRGEHLAHSIAWAMEMGMNIRDLARMPFYHPVIEEALQPAIASILGELPPDQDAVPAELRVLS